MRSRLRVKLAQVWAKLNGEHLASAVVLAAPCAGDCDAAFARLDDLAPRLELEVSSP